MRILFLLMCRGNLERLLVIIFLICMMGYPIKSHAEEDRGAEMLMTLVLNKEPHPDVELVWRRVNEEYLVPLHALLKRRVKQHLLKPGLILLEGEDYVDLSRIPEASTSFEGEDLALHITFPETFFTEQVFEAASPVPPVDARTLALGGLVNYNFSLYRTQLNGQGKNLLYGTPEVLVFSPLGIADCTFSINSHPQPTTSRLLRLETGAQHDWPQDMKRLRLGDSRTRPFEWECSTRFAGIHLYRDFKMQPGFYPFPQPEIKGINPTTTTMDVFLNKTKLYEGHLPPGPYEVKDFPVITGGGLLHVQTQDSNGQTTTYEAPYYTSTTLLKEDLVDYSFEMGLKREQFMRKSNCYRYPFVAGSYRYGVTPRWTTGIRGEFLKKLQMVAFENQFLVNNWSAMGFALAGSQHRNQTGHLIFINWQRQNNQVSETGNWSFGVRATFNSKNFTDLATYPHASLSRFSTHTYFAYNHPRYGDFILSFTSSRHRHHMDKVHLLNFSFKKQITSSLFLNIMGGKDFGKRGGFFAFMSLNMSFGKDKNATTSFSKTQEGASYATASVAKQILDINGWGYRLNTTQGHTKIVEGEIQARNYTGALTARAARLENNTFGYLNAMGSIIAAGGEISLTREAQQSIAIVKVGEFENVRVYKDNLLIGRTGSKGLLLITEIPAYTSITVRIAEEDLPLNSTLSHNEVRVLCPTRGAAYAHFDTKVSQSVILRLTDAKDIDLPVGTPLMVEGSEEEFVVGYDGEVFIPDVGPSKTLKGKAFLQEEWYDWKISLPSQKGEAEGVIDLGTVQCDTSS